MRTLRDLRERHFCYCGCQLAMNVFRESTNTWGTQGCVRCFLLNAAFLKISLTRLRSPFCVCMQLLFFCNFVPLTALTFSHSYLCARVLTSCLGVILTRTVHSSLFFFFLSSSCGSRYTTNSHFYSIILFTVYLEKMCLREVTICKTPLGTEI